MYDRPSDSPTPYTVTMLGWFSAEAARLVCETPQSLAVRAELLGEDLDRYVAVELGVFREVHLAHPARAEGRQDFVGAEATSCGQCHKFPGILSSRER